MTVTATNATPTAPTETSTVRAKRIGLAAAIAAVVAAVAGITLLAVDPGDGSTFEGGLAITAAVSGLATAVLVIVGVVYAQVKGLWATVPIRARYVLWALLAIAIANSIRGQLADLF